MNVLSHKRSQILSLLRSFPDLTQEYHGIVEDTTISY